MYTPQRPCDWRATSITDPRSNEAFTEVGAWEYVAESLLRGVDVELIELRVPPGKTGYVMLLPSCRPETPIYVKLQISGKFVVGRSFHYSET
jgi:hypothetical protein